MVFDGTSQKSVLVSNDALLHTGELKFAAELTESEAMKEELKDFRKKLSETGKATHAARVGKSDDLVLAVAIAAWWITRPPNPTAAFTYWQWGGTPQLGQDTARGR